MLNNLTSLSEDERQELYDAIPVITLLIAGADGEFSPAELMDSEKLTKIRSFSGGELMQAYYDKVGEDYHERLQRWLKVVPKDVASRTEELSARLEKLNPILAKLEPKIAAKFYHSFTSFAKHVARASGGIFGFLGVSRKESLLIDLPMITPIVVEEDEEA